MERTMERDLKIFTDNIDSKALAQIYELVALPPFQKAKIRIMPDVHAGAGCVIGFTGVLGDKVIPNVVGVDLGCGVRVVSLGNIEMDMEMLDEVINTKIPSGFEVHHTERPYDISGLKVYCDLKNTSHIYRSLGTLGGGNHFIEVGEDESGAKYLLIHTGSRNLGKQVADIYQKKAIEYISGASEVQEAVKALIISLKQSNRQSEISDEVTALRKEYKEKQPSIPRDLCYLEGTEYSNYLHDIKICQDFASENRKQIGEIICKEMGITPTGSFESVHNYISVDEGIVRKGAISAKKDELLIIPISMKEGSILGMGKGNLDWNNSAPHGAGRLMSRSQAKEKLNLEDFKKSMEGIYTTSVNQSTLDEAPAAYKSMEEIISKIGDTVEVIGIIKPIYNFKASE
jgi:tRNA-splicing ligase RtcB